MRRTTRLAAAVLGLATIVVPSRPAAPADGGAPPVALIKMPYRGERNLADLSDSPDYLDKGGLQKILEQRGWSVSAAAPSG